MLYTVDPVALEILCATLARQPEEQSAMPATPARKLWEDPAAWDRLTECPQCDGSGRPVERTFSLFDPIWWFREHACRVCGGCGYVDTKEE